MTQTFNLMLTSTGGELSPQLIAFAKSSKVHTIDVTAVDMSGDVMARHFADQFEVVPAGTDLRYADAIAEIVRRHGIQLIIPGSDEEALALSRDRSRLNGLGCEVAVVGIETLAIVADKAATFARLAAAGFEMPLWRRADDREGLARAIEEIAKSKGGAVVKPVSDRGSRGVYVLRSGSTGRAPEGARERHMAIDEFKSRILPDYGRFPVLIMEPLLEPVHDIDLLAWKSKPVRLLPRRRVSSALPNAGHVFLDSPELVKLGAAIVETLELSWLYDCDVMFDAAGRPYVIEVNPRPSGSFAVAVAAGVPLIDDVVSLAKGQPVQPSPPVAGRVVRPYTSLKLMH